MSYLHVIFAISIIILFGFGIGEIFSLYGKKSSFEKVALSLGVGGGFVTLEMFLYSLLGIPWSLIHLILPIILVGIGLIFKVRKKGFNLKFRKYNNVQKILILLLVITCCYVLWEASLRPLPSWDGWSAFYLQGKAFYVDGFLNPQVARYSGVTNPPFVALLIAFMYKFLGVADDKSTLIFFSSFYVALGVIYYKNIHRYLSTTLSLLFTFLLMSTPNLMRHAGNVDIGHADLIVGYFFLASTISIVEFSRSTKFKTLILCQLLLAFGAFVKDEGFVFFLIGQGILLFLTLRARKFSEIKGLISGFFIIGIWIGYKYVFKIPQNPFYNHTPNLFRFLDIIKTTAFEYVNFTRWSLLWPMTFVLYFVHKMNNEVKTVLIIFGLQLGVYIGIYFTTPQNPVEHIYSSFDRLLLHLLPLFLYGAAINMQKTK